MEGTGPALRLLLDGGGGGVYRPGDGMVDFVAVLRALPGHDRWLVVEAEQDPAKANPFLYGRKATSISCACCAKPGCGRDRPLIRAEAAAPGGVLHRITPASAGWRYVGFEVRALRPGESMTWESGDNELCPCSSRARRASRPAARISARSGTVPAPLPASPGRLRPGSQPLQGGGGNAGRARHLRRPRRWKTTPADQP